MPATYLPVGTFSNLTRLQLEQLRRGDYTAGGKALTIGDSGLLPEGVVGPGAVNAEPFYTTPTLTLSEVRSITPPTRPGQLLIKQTYFYPAGLGGSWVGPTLMGAISGSTTTTTAGAILTDTTAGFIVGGIQAGDLVLIHISTGGGDNFAVGVVSVVGVTTLTCTGIMVAGAPAATFVGTTVTHYSVVRPTAVQLFAVPGSGPLGQEQTFLCCTPASTLHVNVGPTTDQINADRIRDIIQPKYALNSSVDRADSVYAAPAPHTDLSSLGYRIVLYPDDGTGTGPNLSAPITALNPVIDPAISADDQRVTVDYAAGTIRFSCAPALGGQIKVAGGTKAATGRLNLYAVYWTNQQVSPTAIASSAAGLYRALGTATTDPPSAQMIWDAGTSTWKFGVHSLLSGTTSQSWVSLGGNVALADADLHVMETAAPTLTSLVKKANAIGVTCGDGVTSFGDFNGADAITQAITYWTTLSFAALSLEIHLKPGSYTCGVDGIVVPALGALTIRGDGAKGTTITCTGGGAGRNVLVNLRANLTLDNVSILLGSGGGYLSVLGSIRANACFFSRCSFEFIDSIAHMCASAGQLSPHLMLMQDCEFDNVLGNASRPYIITVSTAGAVTSMQGFVLRDCTLRGDVTGAALMTVFSGATVCTVSGVLFDRCSLQPQGVASFSATVINDWGGIFYVDPLGSTDKLTVTDVVFDQCTVTPVNTAANIVFLHLSPVSVNATGVAARVYIGKVTIRDTTFTMPTGRGCAFAPFFLMCFYPVIENVTITFGQQISDTWNVAPGYRGNGVYTNGQKWALDGGTAGISNAQSAGVTIAAWGPVMDPTYAAETGMVIHGLQISHTHRKSTSGDLVLVTPDINSKPVDIQGIILRDCLPGDANNTTVPNCRLYIRPGGALYYTCGTNGIIRDIVCVPTSGTTGMVAQGDVWSTDTFVGIEGQRGGIHIEGVTVDLGWCNSGGTVEPVDMSGIMFGGSYWTTSVLTASGQFRLRDCSVVRSSGWGYQIYRTGVTKVELDSLVFATDLGNNVLIGRAPAAGTTGIVWWGTGSAPVSCTNCKVTIAGCPTAMAPNYKVSGISGTWASGLDYHANVHSNTVELTTSAAGWGAIDERCFLFFSIAAVDPNLDFTGNSAQQQDTGVGWFIGIVQINSNGAAINVGAVILNCRGFETGYAGTHAAGALVWNYGFLASP